MELHQTLYSRPFILPPTNPVPTASLLDIEEGDTFGTFDSTMPSSEMTSEISLDSEQVKVSTLPYSHLSHLSTLLSSCLNLMPTQNDD